jgi:hypothetical protein
LNAAISIRDECTVSALDDTLGVQQRLWPHYPLQRISGFDGHWRPAAEFFSDRIAMEELLASQDAVLPGLDRKGKAAFAIGAYSYTLAAGLVPLFVGFRIVPDYRASSLAVAFAPTDPSGPARFRFALTGTSHVTDEASRPFGVVRTIDSAALCDRFSLLLEDHMRPLIDQLHLATGLARAALWRLVADYFAQLFLDAGRVFDQERRVQDDAMRILKRPHSPLANPQLHFFDLAMADCHVQKTFVSRGGCCRQYTADGRALCANCVLQTPDVRDFAIRKQL